MKSSKRFLSHSYSLRAAEGHTPHDQKVMGSNPAWWWAFGVLQLVPSRTEPLLIIQANGSFGLKHLKMNRMDQKIITPVVFVIIELRLISWVVNFLCFKVLRRLMKAFASKIQQVVRQ